MKKIFLSLSLLFSALTMLPSQSADLTSALELASILPKTQTKKVGFTSLSSDFIINKNPSLEDKIKGIWSLGAYGDAQARVTEFDIEIESLHKKRPNLSDEHPYPAIPQIATLKTDKSYARFTDDTHMSLYLAEALLETAGSKIETTLDAVAQNFINWSHADQTERAPGIAANNNSKTLEQLKNFGTTGIKLWSRGKLESLDVSQPNQGLRSELFNKEGGSGAVMRTAPVSIMYHDQPERAEQLAVAQGILTHTDRGSRAACAGFNAAMIAVLHKAPLAKVWQDAIIAAQKYDSRTYTQQYNPKKYHYGTGHFSENGCAAMCQQAEKYLNDSNKSYHDVLDEFRGWGATEALAASLYIFAKWNDDPYLAMTIAINRTPGDSDTIAIMVGELLGAQYGYENIANNFKQHDMNFNNEIENLENIKDLKEYSQKGWLGGESTDFSAFKEKNIKTFNDLAHVTSAPVKTTAKTNPQEPKQTTPKHEPKKATSHHPEFILTIGDMMTLPVDCIVNAANSDIKGGGGIDGIITASNVGDDTRTILRELKILKDKHPAPITAQGTLPEGDAVITSSGAIITKHAKTIRFVIATVGPQGPASPQKDKELFSAYHNSLLLAANTDFKAKELLNTITPEGKLWNLYLNHPIRTVAFPSISTGIFNYPADHAATAAISGIIQAMQEFPELFDTVQLVIHPKDINDAPYAAYAMEIQKQQYKTMFNNPKTVSPVKLSIQKMDGSKQVIYQP